jgi:homoserine O-succinyltransferase/O-acetyltransferase
MPLVLEVPGAPPNRRGAMVIALVNNMPDAALAATESQFSSLLEAAAGKRTIHLCLSCLPEVPRGAQALERMRNRYFRLDELLEEWPDALIVTGTEPRTAALEEEPYWGSLVGLIDWAETHTPSSIWSCLAAHAAAQVLAGIRRKRLAEKRFGLFEHHDLAPHRLLRGLRAPLVTPHSRWNDLPAAALGAAGFRLLSASEQSGADAFVREGRSLMICFQGHPEYDGAALLKEYRRDVGRFLHGEQSAWPALPQRYFSDEGVERLARYRERAEALRDPKFFDEFPSAALAAGLAMPWRASAIAIYRNWLDLVAAVGRGTDAARAGQV